MIIIHAVHYLRNPFLEKGIMVFKRNLGYSIKNGSEKARLLPNTCSFQDKCDIDVEVAEDKPPPNSTPVLQNLGSRSTSVVQDSPSAEHQGTALSTHGSGSTHRRPGIGPSISMQTVTTQLSDESNVTREVETTHNRRTL